MKIVVVSYEDDSHKNHFLNVANRAGVEIILFDAGNYPLGEKDEVGFGYCSYEPRLSFMLNGNLCTDKDIVGVWWRRPRGGKMGNKNPLEEYIHLESEVVVRSLRDFLPQANWVSDPEATRMACRKPVQLMVAKRIGMKIPDTCITNSPKLAKEFILYLAKRRMIIKPVGTSFVELDKMSQSANISNKVIFTQIVEKELILENLGMVRNCPVIFQEAIEKDSDMRITVVDDQVFCAEIRLEGCHNPQNVDWRNYDGKRVYKRHSLPQDMANLCIKFTREMGLRFGCIDMGYSQAYGYTFFEINPQGQWLPSELDLGYPISAALLSALTR